MIKNSSIKMAAKPFFMEKFYQNDEVKWFQRWNFGSSELTFESDLWTNNFFREPKKYRTKLH